MRSEKRLNAGVLALLLLSGCGGGGGSSGSGSTTASIAPTVAFTASNASPLIGDSINLSWTSTNSTSCQATGAWTGNLDAQGAQTIAITESSSKTYQISCTGPGGSDSKNITVVSQTSKNISGQIYERSESSQYQTNAEGIGLKDVIVTISDRSSTTQIDGKYSNIVPSKLLYSDQIKISKSGYIPIQISRSMLDVNSAPINIGLYPEKLVNKRDGFIAGAFTMDNGGHLNDIYNKGYFPGTYDRIKNNLSANLVAISDAVWLDSFDVATNSVVMNRNSDIPMLTRSQYADLTKQAHDRGLKFMMLLGVFPSVKWANGKNWDQQLPTTVPSTNKVFWDAWFSAYKLKVLENTQYAIDFNIEYISLGMNAGFMTSQSSSYWKDIVDSMKSKGYKGKILYQAMVSPSIDLYETDQFNSADANKYSNDYDRQMAFVNNFDYIALDINELSAKVNGSDYILKVDLKYNISRMLKKYQNYPIPLILQMATPSVNDGLTTRDTIEPAAWFPTTKLRQVDLMTQADAYMAVLESINSTPIGSGNVMGFLTWGYYFVDNYRVEINSFTQEYNSDGTLTSYAGTNDEGAYDKSANIRGKPTESLVKWWFDRLK